MARYIDADAFKKQVAGQCIRINGETNRAIALIELIEKQPKADVAPVVHGEWLSFDEEANEWYCSKCGNVWQLNDGTPQENCMNFCTKCGAKMDGKEKKNEV